MKMCSNFGIPWRKKILSCHHDTYLKADALRLVDVFETCRNTCVEHYKLDALFFDTAPALAWQALLKKFSVHGKHEVKCKDCHLCPDEFRLELITEIDVLLMFEKGI